jgi:hypothetical protein
LFFISKDLGQTYTDESGFTINTIMEITNGGGKVISTGTSRPYHTNPKYHYNFWYSPCGCQ